ncbi:MAG: heavy metal-associated domain-containing protein [Oryzomonas sp.]|uniref:heavy-metal-associated domain-containing protein n=1 Tax=Oryzomonas sp. TaxID=2855186 RepID=UPI0028506E6F|nr:heavy metal-associated domain-containing protein [Oryzomonas sp.]MDR3579910.1 heavy metal-associated domain-containing protein [Oryzomonas sp.]
MRKNFINISLIVIAAAFLTLLALRGRAGAAIDSVAVLNTAGMAGRSCADRINKTLQGIKGVATTEVDLDHGRVIVGYDTRTVKPEILTENVKKAGFDSTVQEVVTPERYRQVTGRDVGTSDAARPGCCSGCRTDTQSANSNLKSK